MSALSVIMGVDVSGGDAPPPPSSGPRAQAWSEDSTPKPAAPKKEKTPPKPAKEEPMEVPMSAEEKEAVTLKDKGNAAYKAKKFDEALEVQCVKSVSEASVT